MQYFVIDSKTKNSKIDRGPLETCPLAFRANFTLLGIFGCHGCLGRFLEVCMESVVGNVFPKGLLQVLHLHKFVLSLPQVQRVIVVYFDGTG